MKRLLSILVIILLFTISSSFYLIDENISTEKSYFWSDEMIWVTEWISSDNQGPGYGKGHFYYALARSKYPNKMGYLYEIYFFSDSYYTFNKYYDSNGDGEIDVYRTATKIDRIDLFVNNEPYGNNYISGNPSSFWIVFQGNIDDYGNINPGIPLIGFYNHSPNANIFIRWSIPYPF